MAFHFFRKNKEDSTELNSLILGMINPSHLKARVFQFLPFAILTIMFVGLAFFVKQETTQIKFILQVSEERQANILSRLDEIQSQIVSLKADHAQIQSLQASLSHLQETMATEQSLTALAKSSEVQQLTKQLQQWKSTTHSPYSLKNNHQKSKPVPMTLPFHVNSLDIIAGSPYISIEYQQASLPLRVNDPLAGWKAIDMDITNSKVVFENLKTHRKITVSPSRTYDE